MPPAPAQLHWRDFDGPAEARARSAQDPAGAKARIAAPPLRQPTSTNGTIIADCFSWKWQYE